MRDSTGHEGDNAGRMMAASAARDLSAVPAPPEPDGATPWEIVRDILVRHRAPWNHGQADSLLGPMLVTVLDQVLAEVQWALRAPGGSDSEAERGGVT